jgi:hypothetical protein
MNVEQSALFRPKSLYTGYLKLRIKVIKVLAAVEG